MTNSTGTLWTTPEREQLRKAVRNFAEREILNPSTARSRTDTLNVAARPIGRARLSVPVEN